MYSQPFTSLTGAGQFQPDRQDRAAACGASLKDAPSDSTPVTTWYPPATNNSHTTDAPVAPGQPPVGVEQQGQREQAGQNRLARRRSTRW